MSDKDGAKQELSFYDILDLISGIKAACDFLEGYITDNIPKHIQTGRDPVGPKWRKSVLLFRFLVSHYNSGIYEFKSTDLLKLINEKSIGLSGIFKHENALGVSLGKIENKFPDCLESKHKSCGNYWRLNADKMKDKRISQDEDSLMAVKIVEDKCISVGIPPAAKTFFNMVQQGAILKEQIQQQGV